ncbi:unnamed protein product [Arctia plantaginis]|uniref:Uncharacterized protein n=1 Tax=Arctia plantaginis TaxID=874455 RepID=A0A8S0ZN12_ARCPL|nr:unnamed protein product [Arctia plantaginis]
MPDSRRTARAGGSGQWGHGAAGRSALGLNASSTVAEPPRRARHHPLEIIDGRAGSGRCNRRYSRGDDSATSGRAKCGRRVLPPFVRFSAIFAGRAHTALCAAVSDLRPRAVAPGTGVAHNSPLSDMRPTIPLFHRTTYLLLICNVQNIIDDSKLCL